MHLIIFAQIKIWIPANKFRAIVRITIFMKCGTSNKNKLLKNNIARMIIEPCHLLISSICEIRSF